MFINKIGFIGFGLIGGSLAKTIRHKHMPVKIIAYDLQKEMLIKAKQDQIIDDWCETIDASFSKLDLIFLCAPVQNNNDLLDQIKKYLSKDCILTDVGSVKEPIHEAIIAHGLASNFIGGHPMAGSEKSGYDHASPTLFENAYYVLTPCKEISKEKVDALYNFIEALGALPMTIDAQKHDFATASISHIPHIVASSLVNLVASIDDEGHMKQLAAGGFKDLTRIASSSPIMWHQICLSNKGKIKTVLSQYIQVLDNFISLLDENDSDHLLNFFQNAKDYRARFSDPSSGLIEMTYAIMVDIPDEPGVIAKIATILSHHDINIKNIGIIHNREFEQGVLKIVFYNQKSQALSIEILSNLQYKIYQR